MSHSHQLEVVNRGSEVQLQVGKKKLNKLASKGLDKIIIYNYLGQ